MKSNKIFLIVRIQANLIQIKLNYNRNTEQKKIVDNNDKKYTNGCTHSAILKFPNEHLSPLF